MGSIPVPSALALTLVIGLAGAPRAAETPTASIAWRPFDAAAFQEAKEQGKLILLSIEAPWGHWDKVMSEITFADPNVIPTVNEKFIPIKVDALLRPDIDARYGMGGWPTTAFLLHTGQPFYFRDASGKIIRAGGTYYASEPLLAYLKELAKHYAANKDNAEKAAEEIAHAVLARKEVDDGALTPEILEVTVTRILDAYGHWRPDPDIKRLRLPDVDSADLAFAYYIKKGNRTVLDTALHRLTDMARGGIRDQLGGGFHRIAVDAAWRVPAFEKLLSVNAEMLHVYAGAYMVTGVDRYKEIALATARYVLETLRDPAGWFYAYQAADARLGEDGDYYTWRLDEVKEALTEEERQIILPAYDIGEWGEMLDSAPRRNVIFLLEGPQLLSERLGMERAKVTELFESGRRKLLEARSRREAPAVGKIMVTQAVCSMGASLILAGDLLREPELTAAGIKGLDVAWVNAHDPNSGLMDHAWSPEGGRAGLPIFFSDQVQTLRALLAAFESTGESGYLDKARRLADAADKTFADALNGGYMDRVFSAEAPGLLSWPTRSLRDNSLFAEALVRLRYLGGAAEDEKRMKAARKALESWADEYANYGELSAPYGLAVHRYLSPPVEVIVVRGQDAGAAAEYDELRALAKSLYHPWRVVRQLTAQAAAQELQGRQVKPPEGHACLFCLEARCAGPYTRDDRLRAKLEEFLSSEKKPAAAAQGPKAAGR